MVVNLNYSFSLVSLFFQNYSTLVKEFSKALQTNRLNSVQSIWLITVRNGLNMRVNKFDCNCKAKYAKFNINLKLIFAFATAFTSAKMLLTIFVSHVKKNSD